jgi:hypothetical protein
LSRTGLGGKMGRAKRQQKATRNDQTKTYGAALDDSGGNPTAGMARWRKDSRGNRSETATHDRIYLRPIATSLQKAGYLANPPLV